MSHSDLEGTQFRSWSETHHLDEICHGFPEFRQLNVCIALYNRPQLILRTHKRVNVICIANDIQIHEN